MTADFYPLIFEPVLKAYIWGGRNLATRFGRKLPPAQNIAESWEIAAHPDGETRILNGAYAGLSLSQLQARLGLDLIGKRNTWAQERHKFPLLIKLLDAHDKLSVQVHPDDTYAQSHTDNELGKSEMWVILEAAPDAAVILGVRRGVDGPTLRQAINAGNLEPLLHYLPVQVGDFVCVPAGSLHAILGGILIAEIQQNSNTTYRVYDWQRVGQDGRSRNLHINDALQVINFAQVEPALPTAQPLPAARSIARYQLCHNRYFAVERLQMPAGASLGGCCDGETLEIWGVIAGQAHLSSPGGDVALPAVQFTLLPAALGNFQVTAHSDATVLRIYVPAA